MGPKRTGLVCPACRQPVAIIERETDDSDQQCSIIWPHALHLKVIAL
jgi:hypothetical protein